MSPASLLEGDAAASHDHVVQFYDNPRFLRDAVAGFVHDGCQAGQPVVVIATEARRRSLKERLRAQGIDLAVARRCGQLAWYDARETLNLFMTGATPDADLFHEHVGGIIRKSLARAGGPSLRAYGEMVDVLWRDGNRAAAIRLEDLWNELATSHRFSLLCAYDLANFDKESDAPLLLEVCRRHSSVVPAESYDGAANPDTRARAIAVLQQRAQALEREVEQRKALEQALKTALGDRRRAERDRERLLEIALAAQAEAEQANQLKDEFLAVVSHELRTPLGAIRGWTEIAAAHQTDEGVVKRGLTVIDRNARSLTHLIDELLDISRIVAGKMRLKAEPVDLAAVLSAALDTVRPAIADKSLGLRINVTPARCPIVGDADRLQQVVWNLLSNAVKFTPQGGRIDVSLQRGSSHARLVVRDTGRGISASFLPHVFEPFRQAEDKQPAGGLGLGLALVRHLVESHGGAISATSPGLDRGATFTVHLPLSAHAGSEIRQPETDFVRQHASGNSDS